MRRRRSGPIFVLLAVSTVVVIVLGGVTPPRRAFAEKPAAERPAGEKTGTEKAREHFRSGEAFFKLEKYQEALSEYEQGYIAKSDPSFLYNIAQCHRLMGNKQAALRFYKRFLTEATRVPNREIVEAHIRDLEKALAKSHTPPPAEAQTGGSDGEAAVPAATAPAALTPPSDSKAPSSASAGAASPIPAPPAGADGPTAVNLAAPPPGSVPIIDDATSPGTPASSDGSPPLYKRWWFWTAIGAVVLTGVITTVVLTSGKSPSCDAGRICM